MERRWVYWPCQRASLSGDFGIALTEMRVVQASKPDLDGQACCRDRAGNTLVTRASQ